MRKEITADMYNYNKFPSPSFVFFDNQVKSDAYQFELIENVKDAFDATVFSQRFSEILLKYDYIVGDWGNEQLRLRGFYKDRADIKRLSRISRLEDYLKEYCNYGCAYFVLENPQPVELVFDEEKEPKRRKRRKSRSQSAKGEVQTNRLNKDKPTFTSKKRQEKAAKPSFSANKSPEGQPTFTIRKKK